MKTKLPSICFVGCGSIAASHAKTLKSLYPDIELSFASRDGAKAEEYRSLFKGVKSFNKYEKVYKDPDCDIVFITTPHAYHSKIAVEAADSKKDIIIEKPVTRSLAELDEILKSVKKNRVRCSVAENYMFKPIIPKIRKAVNDGLIGEVLYIEINRTHLNTVSGWRADKKLMGGGALLEGGVHWINFLASLADSKPLDVIAVKPDVKYDSKVPFEDTLMLNINFSGGCAGKLLYSWKIPNPLKGLSHSKIYGTEGVITFETNGLYASVYGKKRRFHITNFSDFLGFRGMHRSFIENYMNGEPWIPSMDRIKTELSLVEKAYASIKSKKFEKI